MTDTVLQGMVGSEVFVCICEREHRIAATNQSELTQVKLMV